MLSPITTVAELRQVLDGFDADTPVQLTCEDGSVWLDGVGEIEDGILAVAWTGERRPGITLHLE